MCLTLCYDKPTDHNNSILAYFEAGRDQLEKGRETKQERKTYGKVIRRKPPGTYVAKTL